MSHRQIVAIDRLTRHELQLLGVGFSAAMSERLEDIETRARMVERRL
jgi:hypothetical protein